jgi:hypothetical protein
MCRSYKHACIANQRLECCVDFSVGKVAANDSSKSALAHDLLSRVLLIGSKVTGFLRIGSDRYDGRCNATVEANEPRYPDKF